MIPFKDHPPHSILVIATRQIGDVLLTTPLVRRMRVLWPNAQIDVLGFAETLGMLVGNPDIRRLFGAPSSGGTAAMLRYVKTERLWRAYDLAFITQQNDRSHLVGFLAAGVRSGIVSRDRRTSWWKRALLAHQVVLAGDSGSVHTVDEKLALLDPWVDRSFSLSHSDIICAPATQLPTDFERSLHNPLVVLHVASMWKYKQWPLEHFTVLAKTLVTAGAQVVITGGSSDGDREKALQVTNAVGTGAHAVVNACGQLDFAQLTGLLRRAWLYVGPDTSVTHLAAALGVQTIALFGPTNPVRWGPRGPGASTDPWLRVGALQQRGKVTLLQGPGGCVPCSRAGCEDHRQSKSLCLEAIEPDTVIAAALEILDRQKEARHSDEVGHLKAPPTTWRPSLVSAPLKH